MSFEKLSDKALLSLCIYGEARGESTDGKIAVGWVIKERVKRNGWFGKGYQGVILKPYQFSCFLQADPNYKKLLHIAEQWDEEMTQNATLNNCYTIADGLIEDRIPAPFEATHYKTINCHASWAAKMVFVARVDHHDFYI